MQRHVLKAIAAGLALWGLVSVHAQQIPGSRFGVVEGFWFPERTCELGVGWERIIFDWSQHQPTGPDDWNTLNVDDRWLKAASLCGREVVALLKNTPAWATDGIPMAGVPRGLTLPIDDPTNYWAAFVYRTVDYYASRGVTRFIIWNEPDIDAGTYGHEFSGDLEDYFQLLKVAYLAAKRANPAARIHLAGTTYWHDVNEGRAPYFERLLDRILADPDAAANDFYFDVMSLHLYFRTETVIRIVNEMRDNLRRHGMDKAIWINEMNAPPTADPNWPVVRPQYPLDLEQQGAFLVQAAALALTVDVERMAAYKLYDQMLPEGAESFGLLTPGSAVPRPAFDAWRFVVERLSDVVQARYGSTDTLDVVHLTHERGLQSWVFWARRDQPTCVRVTTAHNKAYLFDYRGGFQILDATDGDYRLLLPPARCNANDGCFIGGVPFTLLLPPGEATATELTPLCDATLRDVNWINQ
ncbi:hypothetical protein VZO05_07040 [Aggregatilineales bacterium SYSU G02658]